MNKIILALLLFISFGAAGQTISEPARLFPKVNFRPPQDTVNNPVFVGEIRYKVSNSTFYKSISLTGQKWAELVTFAGGGIVTLNTLNTSTQTFATGTSGSDFNISSSSSTHTFNIPDAGASARGFVSTGAQTFSGAKTFNGDVNFPNAELNGTAAYLRHTQTASSIIFGVETGQIYMAYNMGTRTINLGTNTTGIMRVRHSGNTIFGDDADAGTGKVQVNGYIVSTTQTGTGDAAAIYDASGRIIRGNATPFTKIRVVDDADFTIATDDGTVVLKNNTTGKNATLAAASGFTNRAFMIVNSGTGSITTSIAFRTSGSSTATLIQAGETVSLQSDGTDWWLIQKSTR